MNSKKDLFELVINIAELIIKSEQSRAEKLTIICQLLKDKVSYFDWIGFYVVDKNDNKMLNLAQFIGEPTEHKKIKFGQGICGQAAEKEETVVVQDVSKETNYLSCSIKVKSEIVIPIFYKNRIIGELDIDSHTPNPFTEEDTVYLKKLCEMIPSLFYIYT